MTKMKAQKIKHGNRSKEEAIDRLHDNMKLVINALEPAVQFTPPVFPSSPSPMVAVDVFFTIIVHELRSLNESMKSDIMLNIHMYIHKEKKHTI